MEVPCGVGIATHTGPESCTVADNGGGEALTGGRAGRPLSREITFWIGEPRLWSEAEGSTGCVVMARRTRSPRGRRPRACTHTSRTGTGRAHDWPGEDGSQVRANLGDRGIGGPVLSSTFRDAAGCNRRWKKVPYPFVSVPVAGVGVLHPHHDVRDVPGGRACKQVEVCTHQAVRGDLELSPTYCAGQDRQETAIVAAVGEEDLAPCRAVHDVMPAVGLVAPGHSSHQGLLPTTRAKPGSGYESPTTFPGTVVLLRIPDDFSWHRGPRVHSEGYAPVHGSLRNVVRRCVEQFLDCGRYESGLARLRCAACKAEHLVAFSCQTRNFCPSCQAKRAALFAEHLCCTTRACSRPRVSIAGREEEHAQAKEEFHARLTRPTTTTPVHPMIPRVAGA